MYQDDLKGLISRYCLLCDTTSMVRPSTMWSSEAQACHLDDRQQIRLAICRRGGKSAFCYLCVEIGESKIERRMERVVVVYVVMVDRPTLRSCSNLSILFCLNFSLPTSACTLLHLPYLTWQSCARLLMIFNWVCIPLSFCVWYLDSEPAICLLEVPSSAKVYKH